MELYFKDPNASESGDLDLSVVLPGLMEGSHKDEAAQAERVIDNLSLSYEDVRHKEMHGEQDCVLGQLIEGLVSGEDAASDKKQAQSTLQK